jgi:DNA-binding transcriptional regulator YiaG
MNRNDPVSVGERLEQLATKYSPPTSTAQIRALLARAGLSQRAAARELEVDEREMRYWCSGQAQPPRAAVLALERIIDSQRQVKEREFQKIASELSPKIDELLGRIHAEQPSDGLRQAVLDLIAQIFKAEREILGYWEKEQLGHAIAAVGCNLRSGGLQPTHAWLVLALVCTEKSMIPREHRNEHYTRQDPAIDALTEEDFTVALRQLGCKV